MIEAFLGQSNLESCHVKMAPVYPQIIAFLCEYWLVLRPHFVGREVAYAAMEDETNWTYHLATLGVTYSTLPRFKAKKFPVPLTVAIDYENYFAGSNNFLKQTAVAVTLSVYF